jgi:hypothetical protein
MGSGGGEKNKSMTGFPCPFGVCDRFMESCAVPATDTNGTGDGDEDS